MTISLLNLSGVVAQGIGMVAVLLLGNWMLIAHGFDQAESQISVSVGLVASLFRLILSNRDQSRIAIMGIAANNAWIKRMFLAVVILLGIVMAVPYLRGILGFAPTTTIQLVVSTGLLIGVGVWFEEVRCVGARLPFKPLRRSSMNAPPRNSVRMSHACAVGMRK